MAGTILKQNTAETGLADGTTITVANSDDGTAGDAIDAVNVGASNSIQCTTTTPWAGTRNWRFVKASTNQCYIGWTWTGAQADFAFRMGFRYPAGNLAADEPILRMFSGAGYTPQIGSVELLSGAGRKLRVRDTAGAVNDDSATALSVSTDYLVEARWISGTSLTANLYAKGSNTIIETMSVAAPAGSVNSIRLGLTGSGNSAVTLMTDDWAIGHTDWLVRTDAPWLMDLTPAAAALSGVALDPQGVATVDVRPRIIMPNNRAVMRAAVW
jgi:hypothetical protein